MRKRQPRDNSVISKEDRAKFYNDVIKPLRERSDGRCEFCGKRYKRLYVHHILPYGRFPQFYRDLDNMLYVCISCHNNIHEDPFLNASMMKEVAIKKHINLSKHFVICEDH